MKLLTTTLRLACLYSYGCNATKFLRVDEDLSDFLLNPKDPAKITGILKKLEPYRERENSSYIQIFEPELVRAYWLGSQDPERSEFNHNKAVLIFNGMAGRRPRKFSG